MHDIALLTQTADFVVKYGFLAVGLVLTFAIAPAIYKFAEAKLVALAALCFGLAFIVAYGVLNIISVVAPSWIAQRVLITGAVLGVPNGHQIQVRSDLRRAGNAYAKREFDTQQENTFNFPFLLVTTHSPSCLAIAVVSTDPNSDNSPVFNVTPVTSEDLASRMEILARVSGNRDKPALTVWRELDGRQTGKPTVLQPLKDTEPGCAVLRGANGWSIFGRAFAQAAAVSDNDIVQRLQSDDVFARRDARIVLSKRGEAGFELIGKLLERNDNYRLQLGAVVAFDGMPAEERKKAPPDLLAKVGRLRSASDKTMRDTATRALP